LKGGRNVCSNVCHKKARNKDNAHDLHENGKKLSGQGIENHVPVAHGRDGGGSPVDGRDGICVFGLVFQKHQVFKGKDIDYQ